MAATKTANIILTANAKQPKQAVQDLHDMAEALGVTLRKDLAILEDLAKSNGKASAEYIPCKANY